jgi:hypothetical protein
LGSSAGSSSFGLYGGLAGALLVGAAGSLQVTDTQTPAIILATLAALVLVPSLLKTQQSAAVLLPDIDTANHRSKGFHAKIDYDPSSDSFVMTAVSDIYPPKDSEVTISYGNKDNDDLLQYFGFVERDNDFDEYTILDPNEKIRALLESPASEISALDRIALQWALDSAALAPQIVLNKNINGVLAWTCLNEETSRGLAAMVNANLIPCLTVLLKAELKAFRSKIAAYQAQLPAPAEGDVLQCITAEYFAEKVAVLQAAIKNLQATPQ